MFSFLKKVILTVTPWGSDFEKNNLEEEERRILNSIKCMSTDSEVVSENANQKVLLGQSDAVEFQVESFKCVRKTGRITHLFDKYGVIDNVIYFEHNQVSDGLVLTPNDIVSYTAYKAKDNEAYRVHKIISLKNDSWEGEEICNSENQSENVPESEELYAFSRVITGRVTQRKGREVYVESANVWCHLDKIQASYIPFEGDWVELLAVVSISEDSADLTGDILEIKSLKPLLMKSGSGRITFWCDSKKEGAIENLIYFTCVSCEKGYNPNLGDKVFYDAVESDQERFKWRALKVFIDKSKLENKAMSDNMALNSIIKNNNNIYSNKNGISIMPSVCVIEVELNEKKTIVFEVTNTGTSQQFLKYTEFKKIPDPQMVLLNPNLKDGFSIKPKKTIQYTFQCEGKMLGVTEEIFYFHFQNFTIAKSFEISVIGNKEMNELLECKFDTVFKVFKSKSFYRSEMNADQIFYGPRPWKPPKFIAKERKCIYKIPKTLLSIFKEYITDVKKLNKALLNYAPYLKTKLDFKHYVDRFQTLLFIEEIALKNYFRKYDMDEVFLQRSDDYFVLEVPGLAERRPSLIVGDKVILTQPWSDSNKTKHVGYIHFIRAKEIYVKFHEFFHDNFNDSECNITFEPNLTFFLRCHEGVIRAVKALGEDWLFPSSVNEKQPLFDFDIPKEISENVSYLRKIPGKETEIKTVLHSQDNTKTKKGDLMNRKKSLIWSNKKLNKRQKLAVLNVLEGKGRPLPYIIFGPPGTGKTVTLVEVIIQIYRLMSESRILVVSPSNSSADLICERLIELGDFKPGQLLRLVANNRVTEGLVPSKLIPYSSFYDSHKNDEGSPKKVIKNKIRGMSTKELLGRHRITIATCVTSGIFHFLNLPSGHFSHIIVDEAGQTSEPEILISASFQNIKNGHIVLAGDPQQLGPVICDSTAKNYGLGVSLLQRLISRFPYERDCHGFPDTSGFDPRFITELNVNYRSVPEILTLPNKLFYNSDLIPTVSQTEGEEAEIIKKFNLMIENRRTPPAIIFHGTIGQNYQEKDSPSWFNPHEIWQVVFYMRKLYSIGLKSNDIGIVSPYAKQVQKLKKLLPSLGLSEPKIGSVEEFQGQERHVIIVSTVRSSPKYVSFDIIHSLGFVANPQRLNVVLTRARALLIIIGNPVLLSKDPYWISVVKYCVKNNSYIGCSLDSLKLELNDEEKKEEVDFSFGD